MADAYIYDAVRTPRGKGRKDGALHGVTPIALAATALRALRDRNHLDTALVDDVVLGCVEGQLKNAAAAYRTRHGTNGSLDELRAAGLVTEEPLAPPGQCWVVVDGNPSLIACPATEPPP